MEYYWTVNVILTDAERRSIWLSLLFNSTPCLPKHESTIFLLYNKCMLCISCLFRPLKPLTLRMDHAKLLDVLTSLPVSHAILCNYWLRRHWIWCDIDQRIPILTEAKPRSILVFSGRYHIISNASLVNNCFIIWHLEKDVQVSLHLEKILNLYTSFGTVKHLPETVSADLDKTTRLLFYICFAWVSSFNIYKQEF